MTADSESSYRRLIRRLDVAERGITYTYTEKLLIRAKANAQKAETELRATREALQERVVELEQQHQEKLL